MASTYYCDLTADFVDRTGADSGANVYTGPCGFQAAIRGTGNATALDKGDVLWLEGTATLCRMVKLTCGKDVSGWTIGDTVADNNGGAEWTGKLCQTNVGGNTLILVQTDVAYEQNDITLGSGINNSTAVDTTTLSAKACEGILCDTGEGTAADGLIWARGTTDLTDAANNLGQAVLEAASAGTNATNCFKTPTAFDFWRLSYLTMQNATGDGFDANTASNYSWIIDHCLFKDNGGHGCDAYSLNYSILFRCISRGNGDRGANSVYQNSICIACVFSGNTGYGLRLYNGGAAIGCLAYENGDDNFLLTVNKGVGAVHCVADGSTGGSGFHLSSGNVCVFGCRATNNNQYGLESDAVTSHLEDFNVIDGNGVNPRSATITAGPNSDDNPADDGYVSAAADDYNVDDGSEIDSTAMILNWDGV